jgi:hypothetical protein
MNILWNRSTSFTLVLLGLWVNAISTIKFNEFETANTLKITFLIVTYCLTMSITTGLTTLYTTTNLHQTSNDPVKLLNASFLWLYISALSIAITIPAIIYPDKTINILFLFLVVIAITILYQAKKCTKTETSQSPTESEG